MSFSAHALSNFFMGNLPVLLSRLLLLLAHWLRLDREPVPGYSAPAFFNRISLFPTVSHRLRLSGRLRLHTMAALLISAGLLNLAPPAALAQQANVPCNVGNTPFVNGSTPAFTVAQSTSVTGGGNWSNAAFVVDNNLDNKASLSYGFLNPGSGTLRVTDATHTYSAGNFAGFKVGNTALLSGLNVTIRTYNAGVLQETNIISVGANSTTVAGFITTQSYNAIEVSTTSNLDVYWAANARLCTGPTPPECNTQVALNSPTYPVDVFAFMNAGVGGSVINEDDVISVNPSDFATITTGLTGQVGNITVKATPLSSQTFAEGTFAGFDIESNDFLTNKFGGLTITTYLNGVQQEISGVFNVLLIANSEQSLVSMGVSPTGRQTVGFVTTKTFDEIKLSYGKLAGGPVKVYSAIVDKRCAGPALACNVPADFAFPTFPMSEYSGAFGGCLSPMAGQGALTTADTTDAFVIIDGLAIGCGQWVGVRNNRPGDVYPAGTFAGFEISQTGVVSINVADFGVVTTYLNGVQQESSTSVGLIATSFVVGKKRIVGFKATLPFNEIRYSKNTIAAVGLTTTNIHRVVLEKVCPGPALACNVMTTLNRPDYPATTTSYMVPYGVVVGCAGSVTGEDALVSGDPNDFALMTMVQSLGCQRYVSVRDQSGTPFPAGTYAGVEIENQSLITAAIGDFQYVKTYLNGVFQEQSIRGSAVTATVLTGGRQLFGFKTTMPFDEIRYEEFTTFTPATLVATRIYGMVVQKFCPGPAPVCSTPNNVPGNESDYIRLNSPASATSTNTGYPMTLSTNVNDSFLGIAVCTNQLSNPERAISADLNDYAEIGLTGINCAASMTFELNSQTMAAGTWAGVEIENTTAANLDLIGGLTIQTMLGGAVQETRSANGLIDLTIGSATKRKIGFVTSKPYDRIKYIQGSLIGAALGTTRVYGALVRELCAAPALPCNTKKVLSTPEYPISTNSIVGGVCISGVVNAEALGTADPNDYANFTLGLNILCDRAVAVRDWKTTYSAGTYAGFDVQFDAVAELAINNYKIETYLNGVKQEEADAAFELGYNTFTGSVRFPVGFKTALPFNEVRFVLKSLAAASGTGVRIYDVFLMNLCQPTAVACNTTYELTPDPAGFPIVVDGTKSGITGACLGCYISGAENVLTPSTTDYAEIGMFASLLNEAKIAVKNPGASYPAGTRVGFSYQNVNGIFDFALFNATKITTFLNGTAVETKSATNLIELPILTDWSSTTVKSIGFTATQPFDEVQIAFSNTTGTFRVYGAFIDTQNSVGTIGGVPLSCSCASGTVSPAMTTTALANTCPATTVDLNTAFTGTTPVGTSLVWATTPTPTTATALSSTATVSGTYYGFFYDATNQCFSPASTSVVVSITACTPSSFTVANSSPATQTAVQGAMMTGNASTLLNPSGGTAPYGYAAFNPATPGTTGTTIATAHGSVTIDPATGAYTYTPNPGYSGPDSFGLRVCDSSTPAPTCQNVTIPVTVQAVNTNCNIPAATITK
jgi:hypothetical protein